jgi:hypothetical protein
MFVSVNLQKIICTYDYELYPSAPNFTRLVLIIKQNFRLAAILLFYILQNNCLNNSRVCLSAMLLLLNLENQEYDVEVAYNVKTFITNFTKMWWKGSRLETEDRHTHTHTHTHTQHGVFIILLFFLRKGHLVEMFQLIGAEINITYGPFVLSTVAYLIRPTSLL